MGGNYVLSNCLKPDRVLLLTWLINHMHMQLYQWSRTENEEKTRLETFPLHDDGGDSGNELVVVAEGLHLEQLGDHGRSLVGEQHLLRVVRQPQPGWGLVVGEVLHPLQELLSPGEHKRGERSSGWNHTMT